VNTLTAKAVRDGKISIFGGNQWRPNVHVEDIADTIIAVLEAPISVVGGKVFNVGSEENNYTINQLGEQVKKAVQSAELIIEERDVDLRDYKVDFSRLRKAIGKKNWKSVRDGVLEIKKFLEDNPKIDYQAKKYSNIKHLGEETIL
jgi:nucleoside-diphosphate-sugar epimerase